MSGWHFLFWSGTRRDWLLLSLISFGFTGIGYSILNINSSQQRKMYASGAELEKDKPGRWGRPFPKNSQEYEKEKHAQLTLEEIEWQIKDRQQSLHKYRNK